MKAKYTKKNNLAAGVEQAKSNLATKLASKTVDDSPHLIIEARAGTGKTTTLVEGLRFLRDEPTTIEPSLQQSAIWSALNKSKGKIATIGFVAFNKSIATELQQRVPVGVDAMTMHSMGFKSVQKALGRKEPNSWVVQDLIAEHRGEDLRDLRKTHISLIKVVTDLVGLCKQNLLDGDPQELEDLIDYHDMDTGECNVGEALEMVPEILTMCKNPKSKIHFDDMIWLPIVLDLPMIRYDMLLVDEYQDTNRCQQELAKRAGKRLILCGDPKQAIYGFAGADSRAMARMFEELKKSDRDCEKLPLTVTRRCGRAIVTEAQRIVPDFFAHESNPEGLITKLAYDDTEKLPCYRTVATPGDMVVCRVNAPLVSQCFKFIRAGKKANIQGRDMGQGLISTIKKLMKDYKDDETYGDVPTFISRLGDWLDKEQGKENAKKQPSEARLIALQDRHDCLLCFTEESQDVRACIGKIEAMFTDDKLAPGIRLSSIHKAKGLEADRVFFLQPKGAECPHPMAKTHWQREQEMNLRYVAITRARKELVYVK